MDLMLDHKQIEANARFCKARGIKIPTFAQMKDPSLIPDEIKAELEKIGLWDLHPANLFRVTWKNEPTEQGGLFGGVNHVVIPPQITGVKARIVALCGKWFPTGAHKVGATFGCLVPKLVTGQFNPAETKAVWPSTGNFCRGGAYVASLLGCESVAILPENMSRERFEWLANVAGEVIATHGCESNVKEIFDKCWELSRTRDDIYIFNQFQELGNTIWHYEVTGSAMEEAVRSLMGENDRFAGSVFSSGSGGTLACGYYMKDRFPMAKLAACEALQCPTMLENGYGDHRIEGIGDKHIPFIHDIRNTDMVIAIDDEHAMRVLRLFNTPAGHETLIEHGVPESFVAQLGLMGISGIANLLAAIKFARYYELDENDIVATVFTDSVDLYGSRLAELEANRGVYRSIDAFRDLELFANQGLDHMRELCHYERKRIHQLKYFTWVEQQQKAVDELNAQWFDHHAYWPSVLGSAPRIDELITAFNEMAE